MGNQQSVKKGWLQVHIQYDDTQQHGQELQIFRKQKLRYVKIKGDRRNCSFYLKLYRKKRIPKIWPGKLTSIELGKECFECCPGIEESQVVLKLHDHSDLVMVADSKQDRNRWLQFISNALLGPDMIWNVNQTSTNTNESRASSSAEQARVSETGQLQGSTTGQPSSGQPGQDINTNGANRNTEKAQISQEEKEFLGSWFPDLDKKAYIIPVTHIDTTTASKKLIANVSVDVQKPTDDYSRHVQEIKERNETHRKTHALLTIMKDRYATGEVMVMMTQTSFGMYDSLVTANSASVRVTRKGEASLEDIEKEMSQHSDMVIVHKTRGVLIGVSQSVHISDHNLAKTIVKNSITSLTVAAEKIRTFVKEVSDDLTVHTTLVLTNIASTDLRQLQVEDFQGVTCLCKDQMETDEGRKRWWESCWSSGPKESMDSDGYRYLVARFAIPATRVEIYLTTQPRFQLKHEHDVVNLVGDVHGAEVLQSRLHQLSLFPTQAKLLDYDFMDEANDDIKVLWGPPGTGKTILLVLRALQWVKHFSARHILILQTRPDGTAASCLVEYQLQQTLNAQQQRAQQSSTDTQSAQCSECTFTRVHMSGLWRKEWNVATRRVEVVLEEEGKEKLNTALGLQHRGQSDTAIHILADEANGEVIAAVYQWLKEEGVTTVRLWAAGVDAFRDKENIPASLQHVVCHVTEPLRCPGPVVQEVMRAEQIQKWGIVPPYNVRWQLKGRPAVVQLEHYREGRDEHTGEYPWRCGLCVKNIADKLKSLHVVLTAEEHQGLSANDVFILGSYMYCDWPDDYDLSPAPLINGLQDNGYNVRTLSSKSTRDEVMTVVKSDAAPPTITVAHERCVWGLERKIVVYCDSGGGYADWTGRLRAFSRSTSLLIYVKVVGSS